MDKAGSGGALHPAPCPGASAPSWELNRSRFLPGEMSVVGNVFHGGTGTSTLDSYPRLRLLTPESGFYSASSSTPPREGNQGGDAREGGELRVGLGNRADFGRIRHRDWANLDHFAVDFS